MTIEVLTAILDSVPGVKRTTAARGPEFSLPPELDATVFAGRLAGTGMTITRVIRADLGQGYVAIETAKGEHICLAVDDVMGLRWQKSEGQRHGLGMR